MIGVSLLLAAAAVVPADTLPVAYEVGGLKVIHQQRAPTTNVVAVQLYLLGGSRQVTQATAGVEPFLLMASEYGTKSYPGDQARRALARTGSGITVFADRDWTVYGFHGVKQEFDSSWSVFADRLLNPVLDSSAMAIVRARLLLRAERRKASPEDYAMFLAESLAYRGHPYAVDPDGEPSALRALNVDDLRRYAREQLITSRMLLVVVGDVTPQQVRAAVTRTMGGLPTGSYTWTLPPPVRLDAPGLVLADRRSQTNYVIGWVNGPDRRDEKYPAFARAMSLLGGWIAYEVRERNALSYAAGVHLVDRGATGAAIRMSTTRPDSAMKIVSSILDVFEKYIRIPRPTLRRMARGYTSAYVYGTESAVTHAELLARAQLYDGDFRTAAKRGDVMGDVASYELQAAVRRFVKNVQYVYVGDTTRFTVAELKKR